MAVHLPQSLKMPMTVPRGSGVPSAVGLGLAERAQGISKDVS